MTDVLLGRLPKGRHSLSRQQVTDAQRLRLALAMADAMQEKGYVGTPVAEILRRAGVSRETFYQLHRDKLSCFLDALDLVGTLLVGQLGEALERAGTSDGDRDGLDLAERAVGAYLATIAENPAFARLFLVEVHAAGPAAMQRRADLQGFFVDALADMLGARTRQQRFACQAYVAAIASLATLPIATGDLAGLRALREPLIDHLHQLALGLQSGSGG